MKIRTDFVTNSSSSSFVAITITTKDGEVIKGQTKMGNGYNEIPLVSGEKEDESLTKKVIEKSENGIEFCESLYEKLLYDFNSIHDDLYEIRDIEDFGKVAKIHIEADQRGSARGYVNYVYNFENSESYAVYHKGSINRSGEYKDEKLADYFDGVAGFDKDDDFEINDGILVKYNGKLKIVTVPKGVIGIGAGAFFKKSDIIEVFLPDSVLFIDHSAFAYCSNLESINLSEGLQCIGAGAFMYCKKLESLEIPSTVIELGGNCFCGMKSLKEVKIPPYVSIFKNNLFCGCEKLEKIELQKALTEIGSNAFSSCYALKEMKIPEGVTKLGDRIFSSCENLEKLYLPSTLKNFFAGQIHFAENFQEIIVDKNSDNLVVVDGALYTKDMRRLIRCFTDKKEFTVNENTVYIGEYAFESNKYIEKVNIPKSVKTIGLEAFYGCVSLKEIDLSSPVVAIGTNIFFGCKSIEKAYIPKESNIDIYDFFGEWRENFKIIRK